MQMQLYNISIPRENYTVFVDVFSDLLYLMNKKSSIIALRLQNIQENSLLHR